MPTIPDLLLQDSAELIKQVSSIDREKFLDDVLKYAYEKKDYAVYALLLRLIANDNCAHWHYLASLLMAHPFCHIDGAYDIAFIHAKKAVSLAPEDYSYQEYLLFFSILPDQLLSDEEANKIAKEILKHDPTNKAALGVVENVTKPELKPLHVTFS